MAQVYTVVDGPDKFELMVSLFHGRGEGRQAVEFSYINEGGSILRLSMFIWSVEREGMSDIEQWVIKGVDFDGKKFPITFNTKTRKGHYWPKSDGS